MNAYKTESNDNIIKIILGVSAASTSIAEKVFAPQFLQVIA